MMSLLATMLVAFASDAAPRIAAPPPLRITYAAARTVSPTLVQRILAEADALWRPAGIAFTWEPFDGRGPAAPLEIVIEDVVASSEAAASRLGWILFDAHNTPERILHVSYANARALLQESRDLVGNPNAMPISERETYLGRAMGRALAHELGHYLTATKTHSEAGLMRAVLPAATLFSPVRARLEVPKAIRETVLARITATGPATANP